MPRGAWTVGANEDFAVLTASTTLRRWRMMKHDIPQTRRQPAISAKKPNAAAKTTVKVSS